MVPVASSGRVSWAYLSESNRKSRVILLVYHSLLQSCLHALPGKDGNSILIDRCSAISFWGTGPGMGLSLERDGVHLEKTLSKIGESLPGRILYLNGNDSRASVRWSSRGSHAFYPWFLCSSKETRLLSFLMVFWAGITAVEEEMNSAQCTIK